jgi:hypothetical protein
MIGMPIAVEVLIGLYGAGFLLAGFGLLLLVASPRLGTEGLLPLSIGAVV